MKKYIEAAVEKFGEGNVPPPPALLTLTNTQGGGNIHYIQKVFRGSFEVCNRLVILTIKPLIVDFQLV